MKISFNQNGKDLDCLTQFGKASFEEAESFLVKCKLEIERQLANKEKCPFNSKIKRYDKK